MLMLGYMNREALQRTLETRPRHLLQPLASSACGRRARPRATDLRAARMRAGLRRRYAAAERAAGRTGVSHRHRHLLRRCSRSPPRRAWASCRSCEQLIAQRIADNPEGSYTARLYRSGVRRIAQKVGEEGLEVALAACIDDDDAAARRMRRSALSPAGVAARARSDTRAGASTRYARVTRARYRQPARAGCSASSSPGRRRRRWRSA